MTSSSIRFPDQASRTVPVVRGLVLAALLVGIAGTLLELLLIGHTEDSWQFIPVVLLGAGLLVLPASVLWPGKRTSRLLQACMALYLIGGIIGQIFHYRGNSEFELEMYPHLAGTELFWESMQGATPVLAPGTMIQIGLFGLAYAWLR